MTERSILPRGAGGRPSARTAKSSVKREAILRAAIEIINRKSYALATMTEIAASLHLRDATLYYYFPSKQVLVHACHVRSLERFEALLEATRREGGSGLFRLRGFIRAMLDESAAHGPLLYFGDHSYLETQQRAQIEAWAGRLRRMLERFVQDGVADGSIAPCETRLATEHILGMLIWLGKWVPTVRGLTVERLMASIDGLVFRGLAAESGR